jgi:hypothetical protein
MNFTFLHRPAVRKYKYKPQFFVPEEEKSINPEKFDPDKFGVKLRSKWENKRRTENNPTANMRIIIWMVCLLLVFGFFVWKYLK